MSRRSLHVLLAVLLLSLACKTRPSGPPPIGEAFAGPSTLNLRQDLTLQSQVVASVKHGDRLEILQTRRRFVQVRTAKGDVGWTDNRQLLTPEQMTDLRKFAETTSGLPPQGSASVFETLNVHTEPSRTSPSFLQIPENGVVQVIGHKLAPRTTPAENRQTPIARKPARTVRRPKDRERDTRRIPPPPMPAAPKLPANWQQLSRPTFQDAQLGGRESTPPAPKAVMEDWSLIRTKESKVGWVLSRMLSMAIPDEVAQYAEGHRITSYFPLADIQDEGQMKHAWLWTTISHGGQQFEFDGFRVFIWSTKRHRYETVYRERGLTGFYPVDATKAPADPKQGSATFSVIVDEDGQLVRKTYAFNGYRVNLLRREPYRSPGQDLQVASVPHASSQNGGTLPSQAWYSRLRSRVKSWFR